MRDIKIAPCTVIDPSFMGAVEETYTQFVANLEDRYKDPEQIRKALRNYPEILYRITNWKRGVQEERRGTDYDVKVRLKVANKYSRMFAVKHKEDLYLVGRTYPLVLGGLPVGEYDIHVRVAALAKLTFELQMVPVKAPMVSDRHPHHYGSPHPGDTSPLDYAPGTCLGSFSAGIIGMVNTLDIAGLFSMLAAYCERYNPGSPLRRMKGHGYFRWAV